MILYQLINNNWIKSRLSKDEVSITTKELWKKTGEWDECYQESTRK